MPRSSKHGDVPQLVNTKFDENKKRLTASLTAPRSISNTDDVAISSGQSDDTEEHHQLQGDKSRKGSIDDRIATLVDSINNSEDFFTTSTCSGRIIVFSNFNTPQQGQDADCPAGGGSGNPQIKMIRKKGCAWLLVSHEEIIRENLLQAINNWSKEQEHNYCDQQQRRLIYLKLEPAILHIQCRNLTCAKKLMHMSTESGFRNSGMVIGGHENRITVAVRSALGLEVPLLAGENLFSEKYVNILVDEANIKLRENWTRLHKFTEHFTQSLKKKDPD